MQWSHPSLAQGIYPEPPGYQICERDSAFALKWCAFSWAF